MTGTVAPVLRKSRSVQTQVIERRTMGDSMRQISERLRIHRATVKRILDANQYSAALDYGGIRVHRMVPKACDTLEKQVEKGNLTAALEVLHGVGVLKRNELTPSVTVNVNILNEMKDKAKQVAGEILSWQTDSVAENVTLSTNTDNKEDK